MANLEAIIAEKSQQDNQWRAEMQADRENTIAMQDAGVEEITSSPELYVKYLDMQGDNPTYSAGNIALVMFQDRRHRIRYGGTVENLNRGVIDQERSKGVKIFARNTLGRGYRLTDAYDIRQTQGRDLKKVQLKDDSKEMSIALRAILNYSVVPVATDTTCPWPPTMTAKIWSWPSIPLSQTARHLRPSPLRWPTPASTPRGPTQTMTMRRWTWTPRAFPISCAASLASSGTRRTCPALEELYEGWDPQQRRSA